MKSCSKILVDKVEVIDTISGVDEIINRHVEANTPINGFNEIAYLILIKSHAMRTYFLDRKEWLNRTVLKNLIKNPSPKFRIWYKLKERGIKVEKDNLIIDHILENNGKVIYLARSGKTWKIITKGMRLIYKTYCIVTCSKKLDVVYKHKKAKKNKSKSPKGQNRSNDRSPYTVYNTPARIIYTPMGGQNKRR